MMLEDKFTQIQRQNRYLLEKITINMNRRSVKQKEGQKERERMNKSLNCTFRKQRLESIQVQNVRLLKRIQQKKSDYQAHKLKQDWKKQKKIIKNIINYPFIIKDGGRKQRKKIISKITFETQANKNSLSGDIQIIRIRNIGGINMIVTVKLTNSKMIILGDSDRGNNIKIIEIPKDEAIQFINQECNGKIEDIFDRLRYDDEQKVLYLLGKEAELQTSFPQVQPLKQEIYRGPIYENEVQNC